MLFRSPEILKQQKEIDTPIGQRLYWDYYEYVRDNPIDNWTVPTYILYGEKDELVTIDSLINFSNNFNSLLEISSNSKHYFHADEDLNIYQNFLRKHK